MAETVVQAFTEEQASRLSGISRRNLREWDRSGFFRPSFADENRRRSYSRIYTFSDLLSLKVLSILRYREKVPLRHLRMVRETLSKLDDDLWYSQSIFVLNKKVVVGDPETGELHQPVDGQRVLQIPLRKARDEVIRKVAKESKRDSNEIGHVEHRRNVAGNQPVVAGTRISVRAIQEFHKEGYSSADIQKEYPRLTIEDIEAAIAFDFAA